MSDDLTSPEDPAWVDAIVRRALERAAAEPAAPPSTAGPGAANGAAASPTEAPSRPGTPVAPTSTAAAAPQVRTVPEPRSAPDPVERVGHAPIRHTREDAAGPNGESSPRPIADAPFADTGPTVPIASPRPTSDDAPPSTQRPGIDPGVDARHPGDDVRATASAVAADGGRLPGPQDLASAHAIDLSDGDERDELFDAAVGFDDESDDDERLGSTSRMRGFIEWGAVIVGALVVALLIKTFLMQAYYIPSGSMQTTLNVDDRVLVNKLSYAFGDIGRGDLVVFRRPENNPGTEPDLIKRVIGLGGETIQIRDGQVFIRVPGSEDFQRVNEPYLDEGTVTDNSPFNTEMCVDPTITDECTIPEGHIWVMGDNRGGSQDSRYFSAIDEDLVVGRAFLRVWPLSELGFL